jgi:hypothetical protein
MLISQETDTMELLSLDTAIAVWCKLTESSTGSTYGTFARSFLHPWGPDKPQDGGLTMEVEGDLPATGGFT